MGILTHSPNAYIPLTTTENRLCLFLSRNRTGMVNRGLDWGIYIHRFQPQPLFSLIVLLVHLNLRQILQLFHILLHEIHL